MVELGDGQDWKETDVVGRHHWSEVRAINFNSTIEQKATEGEKKMKSHSGWSAGIQWIRRN